MNIFYPYRLVSIFILTLIVSGCLFNGESNAVVKSSTIVTKQWMVVLLETGGIAGFMHNISIDSSGIIVINDLKVSKSFRKKLNARDLNKLSRLVQRAHKLEASNTIGTFRQRCVDCISYKLSIRWQNKQQLAVVNDINLSKSVYNKIIRFLRDVIRNHQ